MRRSIPALALAATLLLPSLAQARPSAAWLVYRNVTAGYTLSYPADWQHFKAAGTNIAIRTADTGAVFDAASEPAGSAPSAADLRAAADGVLYAAGVSKTAKIRHTTALIHGQTFAESAGTLVRANGIKIAFTGLVAYRAHIAYLFATALVTTVGGQKRAAAPAQARALARIVASITITGPAHG